MLLAQANNENQKIDKLAKAFVDLDYFSGAVIYWLSDTSIPVDDFKNTQRCSSSSG
jgi:hypothetical protein